MRNKGFSNYGAGGVFIGPCLPSGQTFIWGPPAFSGESLNGSPFTFYPDIGLGSLSGVGCTVTGYSDGISAYPYQKIDLSTTTGFLGAIAHEATLFNSGAPCVIHGKIFVPSTNSITTKIQVGLHTGAAISGAKIKEPLYSTSKIGEWDRFDICLENHGHSTNLKSNLIFASQNAGLSLTSGVNGDYFLLKDVKVLYPNFKPGENAGLYTNLIQQLSRVQSVSIQENDSVTQPYSIGYKAADYRFSNSNPSYVLDISYLNTDLRNEHKLGFNVNFYDPFTRQTLFTNTGVNVCSFFSGKTLSGINYFYYPFQSAIAKNLYIVDNASPGQEFSRFDLTKTGVNNNNIYYVHEIGNAYLSSYNLTAAVQDFVRTTVSFTFDYLNTNDSTFGATPTVSISGKYIPNRSTAGYFLPKFEQKTGIGALISDKIDINLTPYNNSLLKFESQNVQSYNLAIQIPRIPIDSVKWKYPVSRPIVNHPIASVEVRGILNGLEDLDAERIFKDLFYQIKLEARACNNAILSSFVCSKAKLESFVLSKEINGFRGYTASFTQPINIDDGSLFFSGNMYNNPSGVNISTNQSGYAPAIDFMVISGNTVFTKG